MLKKISQLFATEAGRQNKGLTEHVFWVKINFLTRTKYFLNIFFVWREFGSLTDNKKSFPGPLQ